MTDPNIKIVADLIERFLDLVPEEEWNSVVIFGSSAVVLNGVDIGREVDDLDVFVSDEIFERLKEKCELEELTKKGDVPYLKFESLKAEILKTFPGVEFSEVKESSSVTTISQGLLVGDLVMLAKWKLEQGRKKDFNDLIKIVTAIHDQMPDD